MVQKAKTKEEWDIFEQMQVHYAAERAAKQAEEAAFMAKVEASRRARENALANGGTWQPPHIPTWQELGEADRQARQAAAEEAERQRIASLTPRDIWLSTLPLKERERIAKWEAINRIEYPMPTNVQQDLDDLRVNQELNTLRAEAEMLRAKEARMRVNP